MERNSKIICVLLVLFLVGEMANVSAQSVRFEHDKEIYKQINSMESGEWDFSPGLWYKLFHKRYSGAKGRHFDVRKSNTGQIMPTRVTETGLETQRKADANSQEESVNSVLREELIAEADRTVDLKYNDYKDEFARLENIITEGLLYCSHASNGDADEDVARLAEVNEILCEQIAYYHKAGPGYQLENTKRDIAYGDALTRMTSLKDKVLNLVLLVKSIYEQ